MLLSVNHSRPNVHASASISRYNNLVPAKRELVLFGWEGKPWVWHHAGHVQRLEVYPLTGSVA